MTKEAALREPSPQTVLELSAAPESRLSFSEDVPEYDPPEVKSYSDLGAWENHNGWWVLLDGRICIPQVLGQNWLNAAQFTCHLKKKNLGPHLYSCLATWTSRNFWKHFKLSSNLRCSGKCKERICAPSRTKESRSYTWWILGIGFHRSQSQDFMDTNICWSSSILSWAGQGPCHPHRNSPGQKLTVEFIRQILASLSFWGLTMVRPL